MFTIKFVTDKYAPDLTVVLRTSVENWVMDHAGEYTAGAWTFQLDEQLYLQGFTFKFVIPPSRWMLGDNLQLAVQLADSEVSYDEKQVAFPDNIAVVTEHGVIPQRLFTRNLDPNHVYDVLVVGTGTGGGLLASTLADAGADVVFPASPAANPSLTLAALALRLASHLTS